MDEMTFKEFQFRMKAYHLRFLDERQKFVEEEFMKRQIHAKKPVGDNKEVYVIKKPEDVFNYQKMLKEISGEKSETMDQLVTIANRLKDRRKK